MDPVTIAMGLAQFAPTLIKWFGGSDKNAAVAQKVIDIAGAVTGAETPEETISALRADRELAVKFQEAVLAQELEFEKLAAQNASDINKTMQAETASEHWPSYSWRPFIGFSFGLYLNAQWILPLFKLPAPTVDSQLMLVVGAILGVASWYRGKMQADPAIPTNNKG